MHLTTNQYSIYIYICALLCSPYVGPEPPTDVSVAVMDRGTVVVSWTASQSRMCDVAIVNYSVKYKMRTNTGDYTTVNTSSTSVTLHGLTLCQTVYSVSVAAINSNGDTSVFSVVRNTAIPEMSPGETN